MAKLFAHRFAPDIRVTLVLFALTMVPSIAMAQVDEDFSDGDFTANPAWIGDTDLFTIVPDGSDFALQSAGDAVSDTLQLRTASTISYGTWSFRFAYRNGTLTNFNQVRYFLTSDIEDLEGGVDGYHVQLGTNNRNVRLYRSDPTASGDRILLGESLDQILPNTEDTVTVSVSRDLDNNWFVSMDGSLLFSASESASPAPASAHTGIWIKHSATRAADYLLDDVLVSDELPPDTFPPTVSSETYDNGEPGFVIDFSEPMLASSFQTAGAFSISSIGSPASVTAIDISGRPAGTGALLSLSSPPSSGDYDITISNVMDIAGNAIVDTTVTVTVIADETAPEVVSVAVVSASEINLEYSEAVSSASACSAVNYTVSGDVGNPSSVNCGADPVTDVDLIFQTPIEPGGYDLVVSNVADLSNNILADTTLNIVVDLTGDIPVAGDIVVNEIYYDPPDTDLEFVELYNKSGKTFDLSEFLVSDNRNVFETISDTPVLLEPDSYAVLVRDADVFSAAFPGVSFIAPPTWPALNNTGDAVILQYGSSTVDSVDFSPAWGGDEVSIERVDPDGPSNAFSNWGSSIDPGGATPGAINSIYAPDTGAPAVRFAEELADGRVILYFTEPIRSADFAANNFDLSGSTPASVSREDEGLVAILQFDASITASFLTIGVLTDLTGNSSEDVTVEIARLPGPGDITINEIMFDPRSNDQDGLADQPEYIELLNNTQGLLSLSGMYWTDIPDEDGEADTVRFVVEPSGIEADNYAIVFAQSGNLSRDEIYSNSDLVNAFPRGYASLGVNLLHVNASSLSLLNDGDRIRLHTSDDEVIDEVQYDPDWHHPNVDDARGLSLERIDPLSASDRQNWSSSVAPEGGTPGDQNSIFLSPDQVQAESGITIAPSPFSPDRDGFDDIAAISFTLDSTPALIRARVFDATGRIVRIIEDAGISASTGSIFWDGFDDDGNNLPVGIYVVLLEAIDSTNGRTETYKDVVVLARQLD